MRGRISVGGIEMDAVPAPCCQTGHPFMDALAAPCNPMGLFCPVNTQYHPMSSSEVGKFLQAESARVQKELSIPANE